MPSLITSCDVCHTPGEGRQGGNNMVVWPMSRSPLTVVASNVFSSSKEGGMNEYESHQPISHDAMCCLCIRCDAMVVMRMMLSVYLTSNIIH